MPDEREPLSSLDPRIVWTIMFLAVPKKLSIRIQMEQTPLYEPIRERGWLVFATREGCQLHLQNSPAIASRLPEYHVVPFLAPVAFLRPADLPENEDAYYLKSDLFPAWFSRCPNV